MIIEPSRNSKALESFFMYCLANPEQRFWQALKNWSKFDSVLGVNYNYKLDEKTMIDTYHLEELAGTK
jgi:hypothetical protein